jgi:hypothetical protein
MPNQWQALEAGLILVNEAQTRRPSSPWPAKVDGWMESMLEFVFEGKS